MELGEKLRQARQEAGLSQRQLCGDVITRNMLSQIEHGTARPSMDTLRYLALRLGKSISFFLEEDVVTSPNQELMASAKARYTAGSLGEARLLLQSFRQPDPVLEWEWRYLYARTTQEAARQAIQEGKVLYARQLLTEDAAQVPDVPGVERDRLLLLGTIPGTDLAEVVRGLPSLDEELLLRAEAALADHNMQRAEALLLAAEQQTDPRWHLLMGRVQLGRKRYAAAAGHLEQAEKEFPDICWPLQEESFRELGDFQRAYFYACKQRQGMPWKDIVPGGLSY